MSILSFPGEIQKGLSLTGHSTADACQHGSQASAFEPTDKPGIHSLPSGAAFEATDQTTGSHAPKSSIFCFTQCYESLNQMNAASPHPTRDQLIAFGQGRLDSDAADSVAEHVADCDSCCEILGDVPSDTLADQVRAADADTTVDIRTGKPIVRAAEVRLAGDRATIPADLVDHPRYRIVRVLGAGGMGTVYQAEHRIMDRPVALKVINQELTSDPEIVQRFRQEVRAAAKLSHPNIVTAHDAEQTGDLHFLVMEYVEGIDLARFVKRKGPLAPDLVAHIGRQVALGLSHAAQHSMVHRDIKPQNLIITKSGRVLILDFGLARLGRKEPSRDATLDDGDALRDSAAELTLAGSILGTPDYIAPEQATDSRSADIRADIYSLGCTLYFLLTGQPPFPGGNVLAKLLAHREQTATSIAELRPEVPDKLIDLIEKMMSRLPGDRFDSPADVAKSLLPMVRAWQSAGRSAPVVEGAERSIVGQLADVRTTPVELETDLFHQSPAATVGPPTATSHPLSRLSSSQKILAGVAVVGCAVVAAIVFSGDDSVPADAGRAGSPERMLARDSSLSGTEIAEKQREAATELRLDDVVQNVPLSGTVDLPLVVIPAGEFLMGTPDEQFDDLSRAGAETSDIRPQESPTRVVTISRPFLLGQTEVTIGQFRVFVNETAHRTSAEKTMGWGVVDGGWFLRPGFFWDNAGDCVIAEQHPASNISWHDARTFCDWLNHKSHSIGGRRIRFRLPVEAEWEYACRAGSPDLWFFGSDASRIAQFAVAGSNRPAIVRSRRPNNFGLYDMLGNESEWCLDLFGPYDALPARIIVDESYVLSAANDDILSRRVQRGGTFSFPAIRQRSASRVAGDPDSPAQGAFRVLGELLD